jgi:hypothetical protein
MLHFLFQENKIIKIQALWRGHKLRKMFLSLLHEPQPSFKVVRSFAHHLDFSADDYRRDLQLQVKWIFLVAFHLANKIYYELLTGNFNKLLKFTITSKKEMSC